MENRSQSLYLPEPGCLRDGLRSTVVAGYIDRAAAFDSGKFGYDRRDGVCRSVGDGKCRRYSGRRAVRDGKYRDGEFRDYGEGA